jgi:hypothetical protein
MSVDSAEAVPVSKPTTLRVEAAAEESPAVDAAAGSLHVREGDGAATRRSFRAASDSIETSGKGPVGDAARSLASKKTNRPQLPIGLRTELPPLSEVGGSIWKMTKKYVPMVSAAMLLGL